MTAPAQPEQPGQVCECRCSPDCPRCLERNDHARWCPTVSPTPAEARKATVQVHVLKTWPVYFAALAEGRKTYELRSDDRGFEVGDVLRLREWDPRMETQFGPGGYTGREVQRVITHVLRDAPGLGLADGYALLSLAARPSADTESDGPWRVGQHYGIHVYEGDRPVATFHRPEDAARAVAAVAAEPAANAETLRARAWAWDEGYAVAEHDALYRPYSDLPSAATWKPAPNPYRAALDGAK